MGIEQLGYEQLARTGEAQEIVGAEPSYDVNRSLFYKVWTVVAPVSSLACAYHGYKRNNESIGWAIGWFLLGGIPLTPVIAIAQGFGKLDPVLERRLAAGVE